MKRRDFLTRAGLAGLAACAPLVLAGCDPLTRANLAREQAPRPVNGLSPEHREILHLASLAPSGHNSQPWRVAVKGPGQWVIEADHARGLPAVDPENREMFLSLGAFAQCLATAAAAKGFRAEFELLAGDATARRVLAVHLVKAAPLPAGLAAIRSRRTLRKGQLGRELSARDADFLAAQAGPGAVYFPRGGQHAKCVTEGTIRANRAQAKRPEVHRELAQWIRFTNREAEKHRDGLTPAGMEITGLAGWWVRHFMSASDVTQPDFIKRGLDLAVALAQQGAGWIIVNSPGNSPDHWIEAGRAYCRLALAARERGVAVHPMTQMLEEASGRAELGQAHRGLDIHPQFILRVGYAENYPAPVSPRRPVSWFVAAV